MAETLKAGTLFNPQLVSELYSKVKGESVLAKLSNQTPMPFSGLQQFVFNLEGRAQFVGEGEQKKGNTAKVTSRIIKPVKIIYQARISDEFKYASEEQQIQYLQTFSNGFASKIAEGLDIGALHGLEPMSLTDASFKATNSFDGQITNNVVVYNADTFDDNIDSAVNTVTAHRVKVNGLALSTEGAQALSKIKDGNKLPMYPEFRFGDEPEKFGAMTCGITTNLSIPEASTADQDHAIVGDFQNAFKWGYAREIPLEVIEYGDPDQTGRDLKAYNEVCLRAETYVGWGILDTDAFARVKVNKG